MKTKVFYSKYRTKTEYNIENVEYIEYDDIIMYKYFYRLLEEIDNDTLIVVENCVRKDTADLTHNCLKHYLNQTQNRIILEDLPDRLMLMFDLNTPGKFKGMSYDEEMLQTEDISAVVHGVHMNIECTRVTTDKEKQKYEAEKNKLFDNLGSKDPDTVPRALQLFAGNFKKDLIEPNRIYIARNQRFKKDNVLSYQSPDIVQGIVIDTNPSRLHMIDYLSNTNSLDSFQYIMTDLSIDKYIEKDWQEYEERMNDIYAKANLYTQDCT